MTVMIAVQESLPGTAHPARSTTTSTFRRLDATSLVIAVLMVAASVGGLLMHGLYRDNTWAKAAFRGTDLATLAFAVPTLLGALVLARRGSERARLVWLAVLAYNVYNYAFYLFGTAFNDFFLLYAALLELSLVTLVLGWQRRPDLAPPGPSTHPHLVGGYMAVIGLMFAAMWVGQSIHYLVTDKVPKPILDSGIHTSVVFALDLTLIIPAFLLGAYLLWQRRATGLVLGVVLNVLATLYMLALAFAGGFQADAGVHGASWAATPYIEMAATSVLACWLLMRSHRR